MKSQKNYERNLKTNQGKTVWIQLLAIPKQHLQQTHMDFEEKNLINQALIHKVFKNSFIKVYKIPNFNS